MTNILTDISTYAINDHLPFPTTDYIKYETGFDLFFESGSQEKADALVRTYTRTAWDVLRSQKTLQTANALEYLIATNEEYRRAFLVYVAVFVSAVYHLGGMDFLAPTGSDPKLSLPLMVRNHLEGSILRVERLYVAYDYRKGY